MSVLKTKRSQSKAEYINVAYEIYTYTLNFISRLSARYSRLVAEDIMRIAFEIIENAEKANSVFLGDEVRYKLRKEHLLKARSSLEVLDIQLSLCYEIMMQNPAGCFQKSDGKSLPPSKATDKLDKMAQHIGELLDKEKALLNGVMDSDRERFKKMSKE